MRSTRCCWNRTVLPHPGPLPVPERFSKKWGARPSRLLPSASRRWLLAANAEPDSDPRSALGWSARRRPEHARRARSHIATELFQRWVRESHPSRSRLRDLNRSSGRSLPFTRQDSGSLTAALIRPGPTRKRVHQAGPDRCGHLSRQRSVPATASVRTAVASRSGCRPAESEG